MGDRQARSRRTSATNPAQGPPVQIVGFRVENAPPSPADGGLLSGECARSYCSGAEDAGSPTPVIIPPTFQRESLQQRSASEQRENTPLEASGGASAAPHTTTHIYGSMPAGNVQPVPPPAIATSGRPRSIDLPAQPNIPPQANPYITSPTVVPSTVQGFQPPPPAPPTHHTTSIHSPTHPAPQQQQPPASAFHGFNVAVPLPQQQQPTLQRTHSHSSQHSLHSQQAQKQPQQGQQQQGGGGAPPKAKEMSKAERRALQEAQRAAKEQGGGAPAKKGGSEHGGRAHSVASSESSHTQRQEPKGGGGAKNAQPAGQKGEDKKAPAPAPTDSAQKAAKHKQQPAKVVSLNSTELFAHLQQYQKVTMSSLLSHKDAAHMHPAVLQLGLRYADGSIKGSTARCLAMLHTFCQVIQEYVTPPGKSLSRDLTHQLSTIIDLLVKCRPLSVSMANTIRRLKVRIHNIDVNTPEAEAKRSLIEDIRRYIEVQILAADRLLVECAVQKVTDGDVILTFAYSHIVANVLTEAAAQGKNFRVMVVDCRPELEGQRMLEKLQSHGIACSYIHLTALSFVVRDVTKVFLGAAAVMSNGTVMGRAGNAAVAMMAHAHSKPVLVCCESFKFHSRVQLDSITHNELGDPDVLVSRPGVPGVSPLAGWQDVPRLGLLNLKYDAMPAEYVTMIVTEYGMIPPTSIPVIVRWHEQQQEAIEHGEKGM